MPTPAQQTAAQLAAAKAKLAQVNAAQAKLKDVNAKLTSTTPTLQTFLASQQQIEQKDAAIPQYTPTYNKYFDQYQGIKFGVSNTEEQAFLNNKKERAFYLFDPNINAKREADKAVAEANAQHQAYVDQQAQLKNYIAQQNSLASNQAFNMYFNNQIQQTQPNLLNGYIDESNPSFNMRTWYTTPWNKRSASQVFDGYGRPSKSYLSYYNKNAADIQLQGMRSVYQNAFNSDKTIQTDWLNRYKQSLLSQQASLQQQLKRLK